MKSKRIIDKPFRHKNQLTEAVRVVIVARCAVSALSASKVTPAGALA